MGQAESGPLRTLYTGFSNSCHNAKKLERKWLFNDIGWRCLYSAYYYFIQIEAHFVRMRL